MKNTITRTAAATGTCVLAVVLLTGCGGASTAAAPAATSASAPVTSAAASPTAVSASGSAITADTVAVTAPTGETSTLKGFKISAKRTPSTEGNALLEVTTDLSHPTVSNWSRNGKHYNDPYTATFTVTANVADPSGKPLTEKEHDNTRSGMHLKFEVPAETDSVSVSVILDALAVRKDPTQDPDLASLTDEVEQRYKVQQVTIPLKPDAK